MNADEQGPLSHLNEKGEANMVDVSGKAETRRVAVASARLCMAPETLKEIIEQGMPKGDVLAVARVAGIQGAKRCADLIPLCHPLATASFFSLRRRIEACADEDVDDEHAENHKRTEP